MTGITLQTAQRIIPMIYAYSTPEIKRHDGWLKIGYTDRQTVEDRVRQQGHTVDVVQKLEWKGSAIFDDGSGDVFTDYDFRNYLKKIGYEVMPGLEYCHISVPESKSHFFDYRANRGVMPDAMAIQATPYRLRAEQQKAVDATVAYAATHPNGEFLWNAKPRFGKTLSTYDLIKRLGAKNVLIVTNRPAIANSWYSDYEKFLSRESGYFFVSSVDAIKDKPLVISHEEYVQDRKAREDSGNSRQMGLIEFVSLQDMKGSIEFGGKFDKLRYLAHIQWDLLVIDEAHEGVDTYKTDVAFDHINRTFTLHLSGTPFKALANDKFEQNAIYNWTYADEQQAKRDWNGEGSNPYATLPQLNLFTYQMSEIIRDELSQGVEINGETEEYAFDLNEFFKTNAMGAFVHNDSIDRFLDAMTTQPKFPFSTPELRDELRHTFWLLNRVDSAKALARKLRDHPAFKKYEIVPAFGDGSIDDEKVTEDSFKRVKKAIKEHEYTITLSVGQLTTGVTIPEWTAVLMLSNMKSPALYMQAAFRAQNPHVFHRGTEYFQKKNAYVFDFDPARTLTIFEQFANDLTAETSDGRGDLDERKQNIRTLLNFFPVIGEDEQGEMIELDAEKVLSIPRKIRSQEVVRRGFMSDFLFQNIANVFHAPQEVIDIIAQFTPVAEPKAKVDINPDTPSDLSLDDHGDVSLSDDYVIGTTQDIFGDKIYDVTDAVIDAVAETPATPDKEEEDERKRLLDQFKRAATEPLLDTAKEHYGDTMRQSDKKRLEKKIETDSQRVIDRAYGDYTIERRKAEHERDTLLQMAKSEEAKDTVKREFERRIEEVKDKLTQSIQEAVPEFVEAAAKDIARTIETAKKEKEKDDIEAGVRDHLRGFSRTIPSFLMAYGSDEVTLATFDKIIPADVFKDVTSITLDNFVFLRDGGDYVDEKTGETKHFAGHLFDPVVFDDSVREFLRLRERLANYFDDSNTEDIFDYIPPQKTNQIFTPKRVVKMMVDQLEEQNPGCFDDPTKTFADLYMKSGLYITEIVKRLYNSEAIKREIPDDDARIRHILNNQVYGMAPTRIIYLIATNYILGFDEKMKNETHNFVQADAAEAAKNGTLAELVDRCFGNHTGLVGSNNIIRTKQAELLQNKASTINNLIDEQKRLTGKDEIIDVIEPVIDAVAANMGISCEEAMRQMLDLGYDEVIGAYDRANGRRIQPYRCSRKGMSDCYQAFSINTEDLIAVIHSNPDLHKRVSSGIYQYVDGHLVLNNSKYYHIIDGHAYLTDYARTHMEECCAAFSYKSDDGDKPNVFQMRADGRTRKPNLSPIVCEFSVTEPYEKLKYEEKMAVYKEWITHNEKLRQSYTLNYVECLVQSYEDRHTTFEQLSEAADLDKETVRKTIRGESYPRLGTLVLICLALQLPGDNSKHILRCAKYQLNPAVDQDLYIQHALETKYNQPVVTEILDFFEACGLDIKKVER